MDRRVTKTKKAIRVAFAKLLSEKNIDKITIKDIAELADINRKTFYNYYNGVYELVDEIENEIITELDESLKDFEYEDMIKNPYEIFLTISKAMDEELEFCEYLLKMENNETLGIKLVTMFKERVREGIKEQSQADPVTLSLAVDFFVSGMIDIYKSWFGSNGKISLEEISKVASRICTEGIFDVIFQKEEKHA